MAGDTQGGERERRGRGEREGGEGARDRETDRQTDRHRQTKRQTKIETGGERARRGKEGFVCWLVGCLTSQKIAIVSQGRICSDNFTCCHTETEVADQTFYLTQSQYTDTGQTSPSADPITPGAWQGSHWSANF